MSQLHDIAPPPKGRYPSKAAIKEAWREHGEKHGVAYAIKASKTNAKGKPYYCFVACSRGGHKYTVKPPKGTVHKRKRPNRGSHKTGCPMQFIAAAVNKEDPENSEWDLCWSKGAVSYLHNHHGVEDLSLLASARAAQMDESTVRTVRTHYETGLTPDQSATVLRMANKNSLITPKDISNARFRMNRSRLGRDTKVEALFRSLDQHDYWYRHVEDEQLHLQSIIWFNKQTLELFRKAPDVLLIDCTFKTNRYNLPLLNILATSGNNTSIHLGVALLPGQREGCYNWAFTCIRELLQSTAYSRS